MRDDYKAQDFEGIEIHKRKKINKFQLIQLLRAVSNKLII